MGTKLQPSSFDLYERAEPNEPSFTLLARDPLAPFLVSIWSSLRYGDTEAAGVKFDAMINRAAGRYIQEPDIGQASAAMDCMFAMFAWAEANR